jgi:hypothetical protein
MVGVLTPWNFANATYEGAVHICNKSLNAPSSQVPLCLKFFRYSFRYPKEKKEEMKLGKVLWPS